MTNIVSSIKKQAIQFRKSGCSYNEISRKLKVAKSTLSYWLRNLPESEEVKATNINLSKRIWAKNISEFNVRRSQEYQKRVKKEINDYASEIEKPSGSELFFLGLGLHMAEGSKREKFAIKFTNSDPQIIKIILVFFKKCCHIGSGKIGARIHLHDKSRYGKALEYWSKITKIPKENFWQPQFLISKSSKGKRPADRLENGILQLTISDSKLTRKIRGWSKGVANKFMPM